MAMKYEIRPMKVGFGKDKKDAFAARTQLSDTVYTDQLVGQIALHTMLQPAVVRTVLDNLTVRKIGDSSTSDGGGTGGTGGGTTGGDDEELT